MAAPAETGPEVTPKRHRPLTFLESTPELVTLGRWLRAAAVVLGAALAFGAALALALFLGSLALAGVLNLIS